MRSRAHQYKACNQEVGRKKKKMIQKHKQKMISRDQMQKQDMA